MRECSSHSVRSIAPQLAYSRTHHHLSLITCAFNRSCDNHFNTAPSTYVPVPPNNGNAPAPNTWHHIVVSFNGTTNLYPGNETVYVDGVANSFTMRPYMAIGQPTQMYLGSWWTSPTLVSVPAVLKQSTSSSIAFAAPVVAACGSLPIAYHAVFDTAHSFVVQYGGSFAIGALRMHDHVLTAAQVQYNYNAEYLNYFPTPTPTVSVSLTPSVSGTRSASATVTPSNTMSVSQSRQIDVTPSSTLTMTPSPSYTPSSSSTGTPTPTMSISVTATPHIATAGLLIDMQVSKRERLLAASSAAQAQSSYVDCRSLLLHTQVADYNPTTYTWDNRMTSGTISPSNGDFAATGGVGTYPAYTVKSLVPCVYFNGVAANTAQYLTSNTLLPLYSGIYGNSDWTFEAWLWHSGEDWAPWSH